MIIQCESCSKKFIVKDSDIPKEGRSVQCGYCSFSWHQKSTSTQDKPIKLTKIAKPSKKIDEALSVDAIKASDGKTYKFLGSQWAELLPSGKTGLFARKKIGKELDKITGREIEKTSEKKRKRELDPSTESISRSEKLPDIYEPREGLGFFGYIFLIIIVGFSLVGILKTFEDDLLNYYPQSNYIYELLDIQLEYLTESVKNIIIIINDLINSY
jgi:predicted Zn finger-like uncharacterized protein